MASRFISIRRRRAVAVRLTLAVVALQGAVLLTLWVTPGDPPRGDGLTLWQLMWASSRRPTFYPLAALLLAGVPLTLIGLWISGRHQRWLVAGWVVFLAIAAGVFSHRLMVMLRVLWWQLG